MLRDGETFLRRVTRIDGDRIWVDDGDTELELARRSITGKVVHIIHGAPDQQPRGTGGAPGEQPGP